MQTHKIYSAKGDAAKHSFREWELVDGECGEKRKHVGNLIVPDNPHDFILQPRNAKDGANTTTSLELVLTYREHEPGEKRAWSADEAVEKAKTKAQSAPIFTYVDLTT